MSPFELVVCRWEGLHDKPHPTVSGGAEGRENGREGLQFS